jgi:hypothetical protein
MQIFVSEEITNIVCFTNTSSYMVLVVIETTKNLISQMNFLEQSYNILENTVKFMTMLTSSKETVITRNKKWLLLQIFYH